MSINDKLGHDELDPLLLGLGSAGSARREAGKVARRIKAARFPTQATLEGFDFAYNPKLPAAQIRDLARLEFIPAGEGVICYGPVGVGKSHLAQALGHQACRRGYDVTFTTCSRLLAELAGGHADRSFPARIRALAKPALLICDDFAMREFTPTQADDLYELLCERLGRPGRSLILTSNRSPSKAHMFARTCARSCRNITGSAEAGWVDHVAAGLFDLAQVFGCDSGPDGQGVAAEGLQGLPGVALALRRTRRSAPSW